MRRPNGYVLWEGPSALDGAPIVVILTGIVRPSQNRKTGPMVQSWILHRDVPPVEAIRSGDDASVCGDCPLRGILGARRACYVNVGQAPLAVWRAYQSGSYGPVASLDDARTAVRARAVRLGSYGDPAAAPLPLWEALASAARTWTGYTHQWRTVPRAERARWARLLMASTDDSDTGDAWRAGWRTFRVGRPAGPADRSEVQCPAERGLTTCDRCSLCRGTTSGARSVVIAPHGSGARYASGPDAPTATERLLGVTLPLPE